MKKPKMTDKEAKALYDAVYPERAAVPRQFWISDPDDHSYRGIYDEAQEDLEDGAYFIEKYAYDYAVDQWDYFVEKTMEARHQSEKLAMALKAMIDSAKGYGCGLRIADEALAEYEGRKR